MKHTDLASAGMLAAALFASGCAAPGAGGAPRDDVSVTEAQVQARYPTMSSVHIRKCDKTGDGLYDNAELACVRSIYLATRNRD